MYTPFFPLFFFLFESLLHDKGATSNRATPWDSTDAAAQLLFVLLLLGVFDIVMIRLHSPKGKKDNFSSKKMSSFRAQNHDNRNAHQNPVKSHRGGYLRCPFNISATYAEMAEKRVRDDLARGCGGSSARGAVAVADKDGLQMSSSFSSSAVGAGNGSDDAEVNEGRPWSRAGVGASKLSGKEKRTQQEQAELIYGRGAMASGGDDATAGTVSLERGPSQENMFAVDKRDQAVLQQAVPRAVREKVKRRKLEEMKRQGRMQLGHHTPRDRGERSGDEEGSADRTNDGEGDVLSKASATVSIAKAAPVAAKPSKGALVSSTENTSVLRHSPPTPQAGSLQRGNAKPKNRMQLLDDLRSSALLGKKRWR